VNNRIRRWSHGRSGFAHHLLHPDKIAVCLPELELQIGKTLILLGDPSLHRQQHLSDVFVHRFLYSLTRFW
jgi:hypothetical protein